MKKVRTLELQFYFCHWESYFHFVMYNVEKSSDILYKSCVWAPQDL